MSVGLIDKKLGMTRQFFDSGISVPVTVLSIEKGRIIENLKEDMNDLRLEQINKPLKK